MARSPTHQLETGQRPRFSLGGDQGEVFFNFSPKLKKAEFEIKDSDYGDFVVAELAKVL